MLLRGTQISPFIVVEGAPRFFQFSEEGGRFGQILTIKKNEIAQLRNRTHIGLFKLYVEGTQILPIIVGGNTQILPILVGGVSRFHCQMINTDTTLKSYILT